jgi:hypothetical protein
MSEMKIASRLDSYITNVSAFLLLNLDSSLCPGSKNRSKNQPLLQQLEQSLATKLNLLMKEPIRTTNLELSSRKFGSKATQYRQVVYFGLKHNQFFM